MRNDYYFYGGGKVRDDLAVKIKEVFDEHKLDPEQTALFRLSQDFPLKAQLESLTDALCEYHKIKKPNDKYIYIHYDLGTDNPQVIAIYDFSRFEYGL